MVCQTDHPSLSKHLVSRVFHSATRLFVDDHEGVFGRLTASRSNPVFGSALPFITFYPAVVVIAWLAGAEEWSRSRPNGHAMADGHRQPQHSDQPKSPGL